MLYSASATFLPADLFFFVLYADAAGETTYQSRLPFGVASLVTDLLIPGTGTIRKKKIDKLSKISKVFEPSLELLAAQTERS
jgi:hypothetical protein